jgi:hypothetical protein
MGQKVPVHSTLITRSARSILRPMGLTQKGRSRTWLDDHGWWLCVVEFQPSGWSRGSYLNVGCCWLWQVKDYLSFDEGSRVEGFTGFENEAQFASVSDQLAQRAAGEVSRYRKMFSNVKAIAEYYRGNRPSGFWPSFNAAIACALSGSVDEAHRFLSATIYADDDRDWALAAKADARELDAVAADTLRFRSLVEERVQQTRALMKLAPVPINFADAAARPAP